VLKPSKLDQITATLAMFILVSSPSVKVFYSSTLINISALVLLLFVYFRNMQEVVALRFNRKIFSYYLISVLLFFSYLLFGKNSLQDFEGIFRYIYLLTSLYLVASLDKYILHKQLIWGIVAWGLLIGVLKLVNLLNYSGAGQTYLTVGLPMGAGLTGALMTFAYTKESVLSRRRLLSLVAIIVIMSALLISRGRSNILYPAVVFIITLGCNFFFNKKERLKYAVIMIFTAIMTIFSLGALMSNNEYKSINRLTESVGNVEEEARYAKWVRSIQLISENPFGYGVDSCYELIGNYPHNIFIEITLSFGVIIFILFLVFVTGFFRAFTNVFSKIPLEPGLITVGAIAIYFFLSWNTSFDLGTAYIPLSLMLLFIRKKKANGYEK